MARTTTTKKETAAAPAAEKKTVRKTAAAAAEKKVVKKAPAKPRKKKVVPNFVIQSSADQSVTYDAVLEKVNAIPFTAQDKPLFCIPDVTISRVKFMGGGRHVELHLKDSTAVRTVTWWNHGQFYRDMGSPEKVHIICGIQQDFRMDKTFATLDIVDIVPVKEEGKQNAA